MSIRRQLAKLVQVEVSPWSHVVDAKSSASSSSADGSLLVMEEDAEDFASTTWDQGCDVDQERDMQS